MPLAPEKKEEAIPDNLSSTLSALEQATRLLARNPARSNDDYSNAEKVKFTSYKNAGTGQNQTSIDHIIWQWETEFDSAGIPPKVSRVLGLMQPGGNLSDWKDTFRSISRDINDPDDIRNWSWARFCQEMYASTMYTPPDKKKLLDAFLNVKCQDPGTPEQITAYTTQFSMALQNLKLNRLHDSFSPAQQAQTYYNNLTKLVKYHMALRDPKREDPEIRTDLTELRAEVHNVVKWTVFKDAASQAASGGRAVGALGLNAGPRNVAPTKRLEPQKGEIVKFSKATPQSEHWLSSNAARFKCRHALVSGGSRHVLVGNPINLNALFANSEACSAGIIDMPRRPPRPMTPHALPMLTSRMILSTTHQMCQLNQFKQIYHYHPSSLFLRVQLRHQPPMNSRSLFRMPRPPTLNQLCILIPQELFMVGLHTGGELVVSQPFAHELIQATRAPLHPYSTNRMLRPSICMNRR